MGLTSCCFLVGFAQYTIIPARYCYQLKTNLHTDKACLLERKLERMLTPVMMMMIITSWSRLENQQTQPTNMVPNLGVKLDQVD